MLNIIKSSLIPLLGCILFSIILLPSCKEDTEAIAQYKEKMIAEIAEEKISNYIRIRKEACRKKVLEEGVRQVDSLLIARAKSNRNVDLAKPDKPLKPERPDIINYQDSLGIKPILKDSLN